MKKVFLNLTVHPLLPEQREAAKRELGVQEFLEAGDVLPPEIVQKLRQCPSDPLELTMLAYAVAGFIVGYATSKKVHVFVHLPAGSPAFMWAFADVFPNAYATPVFSHSSRESIEERLPDGTVRKRSVFKFERFIVF